MVGDTNWGKWAKSETFLFKKNMTIADNFQMGAPSSYF